MIQIHLSTFAWERATVMQKEMKSPGIVSQCSDCGNEARVERGTYRFRESGLDNVVLKGIEIVKCPACGNEDPILPNLDGLLRIIAVALVTSKLPLSGAEVRYL